MATFDTLYKCTLGGSNFQLSGLKESNQSVRSGGMETARQLSITGEGWVEGSSGADLAAKIAAVRTAMKSRGQDFQVTGLGGAIYCDLPAATCLDGGPHVDFEMQDTDTPLVQRFSFALSATQAALSGPLPSQFPVKEDTRKLTIEEGADGLRTIGIEASVSGAGSEEFFRQTLLPQLNAQYPWPNWVVKFKYDINLNNDKLEYSLTAKELAGQLPTGVGAVPGDDAVDGDLFTHSERDGERLLFTTSCDFLVVGDPQNVVIAIRPAGLIVKESVEIGTIQEVRLRASFTELRSVDGTGLLEWESDVEVEREDAIARGVSYDSIQVDLVYDAQPFQLTLSVRAVGVGRYPKEPSISPPKGYVASSYPKPRLRRVNAYERETNWTQSFVGNRGLGTDEIRLLEKALARPATPEFYA